MTRPTQPLRVGIAGLGFGAAVHVPGFRRIPGVEVAGICGRDSDRAAAAAARLEIPQSFASIEAMLDAGFDAVSLALPPMANTRGAGLAASLRVPVLCEKPLALDPRRAHELSGFATGTTNGVDFQFAELDAFIRLRELVTDDALGGLRRVQVTWRTESHAHRTQTWSWKTDRDLGGGVVTLLGTHLLYLLEWACGPASELHGERSVVSPHRFAPADRAPADDAASIRFGLASGAAGEASLSNASPGEHVHRWELAFDRGTAILCNDTTDYMRGFTLRVSDDHGSRLVYQDVSAPIEDGRIAPFTRLAARFVDAVRRNAEMRPSFADAARVAELAARIAPLPSTP